MRKNTILQNSSAVGGMPIAINPQPITRNPSTNSMILKGVNLKKGCVVAANTIVTENVESENLIGIKSEIKCINNQIQWKR